MKLNKLLYLIIFTAAIVFGGCKKGFLDINDDPNRATDAVISARLLFPQAVNAASNLAKNSGSNTGSVLFNWVGYTSSAGDFALPSNQTTYDVNPPYVETTWDAYYNTQFDLYLTQQKALTEKDSVLAGAAMVVSAKIWQDMVDTWGNIPFSEAFQNGKTRTPKYDKDVDIYNALQKMLDDAITYLQKTPINFAAVDVVNHGDITKWIKFANTIKLRLLIHQSEVPGFNPAPEIAKIIAKGGVLHQGETVGVNPGYVNEAGKQNPYYANWGFTPTGVDAIPSNRANAYIINILKATNDPRLSRFFAPVGGTGSNYVGTVYGLASGNPSGAQSSKMGPGLIQSASQDQWIMPSFESMFLEAEAIARGWMTGNAQTAYENAVRESFVWLGVPDAVNAANTYMANNAIANWANSGATVQSKVKFIAYQKYIAMTGVDPLEAWVDIRRLNMLPNNGYISVNPGRLSNTLPLRFPYAQSEYNTNGTNVNAEGTNNVFTHKIFWQP